MNDRRAEEMRKGAETVVPAEVVMSQQSTIKANADERLKIAKGIIENEKEAAELAARIELEECPKTNIPTKTLNGMLTLIKYILKYGLMTAPEALAGIRSFVYQYWYKVKDNLIDARSRSLLNEIYILLGVGARPLSIAYACKQPMSKWFSMIKEFGENVFTTYELALEKERLLNEEETQPGGMEISRLEDLEAEERREAIHALLSLQDEDGDSFTEDENAESKSSGGKRHTRKHKKQNKSRKQMKHKKTKRHRKKTKKHLKKRNNKKQRKTRNRK